MKIVVFFCSCLLFLDLFGVFVFRLPSGCFLVCLFAFRLLSFLLVSCFSFFLLLRFSEFSPFSFDRLCFSCFFRFCFLCFFASHPPTQPPSRCQQKKATNTTGRQQEQQPRTNLHHRHHHHHCNKQTLVQSKAPHRQTTTQKILLPCHISFTVEAENMAPVKGLIGVVDLSLY